MLAAFGLLLAHVASARVEPHDAPAPLSQVESSRYADPSGSGSAEGQEGRLALGHRHRLWKPLEHKLADVYNTGVSRLTDIVGGNFVFHHEHHFWDADDTKVSQQLRGSDSGRGATARKPGGSSTEKGGGGEPDFIDNVAVAVFWVGVSCCCCAFCTSTAAANNTASYKDKKAFSQVGQLGGARSPATPRSGSSTPKGGYGASPNSRSPRSDRSAFSNNPKPQSAPARPLPTTPAPPAPPAPTPTMPSRALTSESQ